MNVVYAADDRYAPILAVSILSLHKYNENLDIVIIDNGIKDLNITLIKDIASQYNSNITFVKGRNIDELFPFALNMDRGSMAQFSRLFISAVLPNEWNRVLYLDCDTLIKQSLQELYEIAMGEKIVAGVGDAFGRLHWKQLRLKESNFYINSGVMLIDLKGWRSQNIEKQIIQFILKNKGKILQGDQGIINAVLKNRIFRLAVQFNVMTYNFDFSYKEMLLYRNPYKYYSEKEITYAKSNPVIIHFTSSFASMRPWEQSSNPHPFANEWKEYAEELGLSFEGKKKKLSCKMYELLPHGICLLCLRIIHAYLKPILLK